MNHIKRVLFFKAAQICPICPNWPVSDLFTLSDIQTLFENSCPYTYADVGSCCAHALTRLRGKTFCLFEYSCPIELEYREEAIYVVLINCAWLEGEGGVWSVRAFSPTGSTLLFSEY